MSRARRPQNSSSLFSFLDVMVCTIGALIMLMLAMTLRIEKETAQRAAQEATRRVASPPPLSIPLDATVELGRSQSEPLPRLVIQPEPLEPPPPATVDPDAEVRVLIGQLTAERDEKRQELQRQESLLTAARSSLQRQEGELGQLAAQIEEAGETRARLAQQADQLEELWTGLSGQLARSREEVQRIKEAKSSAPSRYAVLPFDGFSGTTRRPIYIEFSGDGVRFLPENILLTEDDFEGYTYGLNPLLAGASALVNYWMVQDARAGRDEPPPYVLMIVRPSGVRYYPARLLLSKMQTPNGYELVEEDFLLALPEADPQAAAACRAAIERVRAVRGPLNEALGDARGPQGRFGSENGGGGRVPGGEHGGTGRDPREPGLFRGGGRPIDLVAPDLERPEPRPHRGGDGFVEAPGDFLGNGLPERPGPPNPGQGASSSSTPSGVARTEPATNAGVPQFTPGVPRSATRGQNANADRRDSTTQTDQRLPVGSAGRADGTTGNTGSPDHRSSTADPTAPPEVNLPWYRRPELSRDADRPRRRRWGHSDPQGTIAFEREIVVRADGERIVIGQQIVDASASRDPEVLLREVLNAIEMQARTWGHAPRKFYWSPSLRFQVTPEGNHHYEALRGPLESWGLSSKVESLPQRP